MGKGGEQVAKKPVLDAKGREVPTLAEVRASIPKHCFKHSVPHALFHVVRDAAVIGAFGAAAWYGLPGENLGLVDWVLWMVYGFWQGAAFTGWWVLAHECGHGGFSQYEQLNDAVGWVLHSFLLVPYYSWQYSHAKHHANTNSIQDGESHTPNTKSDIPEYQWMHETIGDDAFAVWQVVAHLLFGWPMYLVFNFTGARRLHDDARRPRGRGLARRPPQGRAHVLAGVPLVQRVARAVHVAAAHEPRRAAVRRRRVDVAQGRALDDRPPLRRVLPLLRLDAPPHRLDARVPPHLLAAAVLPRRRGDRGPQGVPRAQGAVQLRR